MGRYNQRSTPTRKSARLASKKRSLEPETKQKKLVQIKSPKSTSRKKTARKSRKVVQKKAKASAAEFLMKKVLEDARFGMPVVLIKKLNHVAASSGTSFNSTDGSPKSKTSGTTGPISKKLESPAPPSVAINPKQVLGSFIFCSGEKPSATGPGSFTIVDSSEDTTERSTQTDMASQLQASSSEEAIGCGAGNVRQSPEMMFRQTSDHFCQDGSNELYFIMDNMNRALKIKLEMKVQAEWSDIQDMGQDSEKVDTKSETSSAPSTENAPAAATGQNTLIPVKLPQLNLFIPVESTSLDQDSDKLISHTTGNGVAAGENANDIDESEKTQPTGSELVTESGNNQLIMSKLVIANDDGNYQLKSQESSSKNVIRARGPFKFKPMSKSECKKLLEGMLSKEESTEQIGNSSGYETEDNLESTL